MSAKLSGVGVYAKSLFGALKKNGLNPKPVFKATRLLKKNFAPTHLSQSTSPFILDSFQGLGNNNQIIHGPDFRILPSLSPCKKVVTIHDVAVFHSDLNSIDFTRFGQEMFRQLIFKSRPDRIIVPSAFIKKEVEELFPHLQGRVHSVYHGADHIVSVDEKPLDFEYPYFLHIGRLEYRKNLLGVLKAFEIFCQRVKDVHLIIVGMEGFRSREILQAIHDFQFPELIHYFGFIPESQLSSLYRNAKAFVFPSFYEGFGFPIVESMKLGCPLITSDRGTMKEVAGDAALLVNPNDPESILNALEQFQDDAVRQSYISRGKTKVESFTWQKNAQQVIDIYRD